MIYLATQLSISGLLPFRIAVSVCPYDSEPRPCHRGETDWFIRAAVQWRIDNLMKNKKLTALKSYIKPVQWSAVLGFDISQAGELWVVGRGVREVTTQFLLSSVERVSSLVCSRLHAGEGRRPTLATSCSSWQAGLSGYQQEDPGSRVPALWRAAGPGLRGAGPPVGVDRERECLPPGQDWAVAQTEHQPAGRGQAGQPQSHYYYYY